MPPDPPSKVRLRGLQSRMSRNPLSELSASPTEGISGKWSEEQSASRFFAPTQQETRIVKGH